MSKWIIYNFQIYTNSYYRYCNLWNTYCLDLLVTIYLIQNHKQHVLYAWQLKLVITTVKLFLITNSWILIQQNLLTYWILKNQISVRNGEALLTHAQYGPFFNKCCHHIAVEHFSDNLHIFSKGYISAKITTFCIFNLYLIHLI